jgi:hypothetical protein
MSERQDKDPDDGNPTPERQAELRRVYKENAAVGRPPYTGETSWSREEVAWILQERGWSQLGAEDVPPNRAVIPDLRDTSLSGDFTAVNLSMANLSGCLFNGTNLSRTRLYLTNLSNAIIINSDLSL